MPPNRINMVGVLSTVGPFLEGRRNWKRRAETMCLTSNRFGPRYEGKGMTQGGFQGGRQDGSDHEGTASRKI